MAPERRLRAYGLVLGVLFFLWLPIEDTHTRYILLLAAGLSAWLGLRYSFRIKRSKLHYALLGGFVGLVVAPLALVLMAVKVGLHAHGFSDFTPSQVLAVVKTAPWWLLGGAFAGWLAASLGRGQTSESA